jgi:hypothetical protein
MTYHRFDWEARAMLILAALIVVAGGFWAGRATAPDSVCWAHYIYEVDTGLCVRADVYLRMQGSRT